MGAATTDSTGKASLDYTIPTTLTVGTHILTAQYNGESIYLSSKGTGTLTVN